MEVYIDICHFVSSTSPTSQRNLSKSSYFVDHEILLIFENAKFGWIPQFSIP